MVMLASILGWDDWGGFMINVLIAAAAIVLCFPLGVMLALGRASKLPLLKAACTAYIEIFRGSPLFVLLLLANNALEFFVPRSLAPGVVVRAVIVFTLFTAAYLAEIVRGGLQSVPPGQDEAAKALGLSPTRATLLITMPQALRNVIPAQIGQFISLFKDVSLAGTAMGVFDLLNVGRTITKQPDFAGQRLDVESLAFVALLFWVGSYTMSRESQRLEKKLGVGTR
jgi:general L-amino acid transport system permease protein